MKVDVWRAFFTDYRKLDVGTLYHKDGGPQGYSNMASDFEVVNKMHLDMANEKIKELTETLKSIKNNIGFGGRENLLAAMEKIKGALGEHSQ